MFIINLLAAAWLLGSVAASSSDDEPFWLLAATWIFGMINLGLGIAGLVSAYSL